LAKLDWLKGLFILPNFFKRKEFWAIPEYWDEGPKTGFKRWFYSPGTIHFFCNGVWRRDSRRDFVGKGGKNFL